MRFSNVHKFAAYTIAILGLVALCVGGELRGASTVALSFGVLASWFAEGEVLQSERYNRAWNVAIVLALAVQIARATLLDTPALTAIIEFAALVQLLKLATRRNARDYQQITVLALLHLVAATVLGGGLSYAVCFAGFVIATPWAMTLGHLRREIEGNYLADARAGRAGVPIDVARILRSRRVVGFGLLAGSSLLSVPIFVLTALLFVLFPRLGFGMFSLKQRGETVVSGFGSTVDLSGHGVIRNDPTIVLRIEPLALEVSPPRVRSFRLRGATFDQYNGHGWARHPSGAESVTVERVSEGYAITRLPDPSTDLGFRIVLDPLSPPVVLVPDGAVGLRIEPRLDRGYPHFTDLQIDRDDGIRYSSADELGLVYTAYVPRAQPLGVRSRRSSGDDPTGRYLQLPADLSPEIRALARRVTQNAHTPLDKARAVERFLSSFRYTLRFESGQSARPLDDFLFRSHAGHCEYFSTAMAVLLRAANVPTRNVTGFLGGTFNRYGRFYAVHQGDAHSWVEVYDPAYGWLTFDPTPPAGERPVVDNSLFAEVDAVVEAARLRWRRYIVGYDLTTQTRLAIQLWHAIEARRHRDFTEHPRWQSATARTARRAPVIPVKKIALGVVLALVAAAGLVSLRRSAEGAEGASRLPAVRDAQRLAKLLDAFLAARGQTRPANVSPLRFARDFENRGDPSGPLVRRIATRYVQARFGDAPLGPDEFDALRSELAKAPQPPTPPR